jgi:ribonuclease P protein component
MTTTNTFPKNNRLKSRKKLQQLFAHGQRIQSGNLKILFAVDKGSSMVKCGVGLNGRFFKKAVDRNRIKRLLREAYRLQQQPLQQFAQTVGKEISFFILYTGKELPVYQYIIKHTGVALQKLLTALHEANTENT